MHQITSLNGIRTSLGELSGERRQTLLDISSNQLLLVLVLSRPITHIVAIYPWRTGRRAISIGRQFSCFHRASQGHGAPRLSVTVQQHLWGSHEPCAGLGR